MKNSDYNRVLPVALTPEEFETKSKALADICKEINLAKDRAKTEAKMAKEAIDELESQRFQLATMVQDKMEERAVECYDAYNYNERMVESIRKDTGEVIGTRAMQLTEYQAEMDLHGTVPFSTPKAAQA